MLFVLHLVFEGITEVDTDLRGGFVPFKITPSNESSLFVPLQGIAPENRWLGGAFWKDYKTMLGDLYCTVDKIDRDGENKTKRLYRCCSNYTLSKLIVDNRLEDSWKRKNPDSSEFTCYDRSFDKDPGYTGSILI